MTSQSWENDTPEHSKMRWLIMIQKDLRLVDAGDDDATDKSKYRFEIRSADYEK